MCLALRLFFIGGFFINISKFSVSKNNHNVIKNLYSASSINSAINRVDWYKEFPNFKEIKSSAAKYSNIVNDEIINRNSGNGTSESTMRNKVDSLFWHDILGYELSGSHFNLIGEKKTEVNEQHADFIIGDFSKGDDTKNKSSLTVKAIVEIEDSTYNFDITNREKGVRQAFDYSPLYQWDTNSPRYIIATNFITLRLYIRDALSAQSFDLTKLDDEHELKKLLLFLSAHFFINQRNSIHKHKILPEEKNKSAVTAKAAAQLGNLDIIIRNSGYSRKEAHLLVTRVLFLLFADSTTIFSKNIFQKFLLKIKNSNSDDLGEKLTTLFRALNTSKHDVGGKYTRGPRFYGYDHFPYINGNLFEQNSQLDHLGSDVLEILLEASKLDWSKVNPIILGSMFEGAINSKSRRNLGAHYTSESNIERVIKPLFLDKLYAEFNSILQGISVKSSLVKFKKKLANLKFLDPACGSGNFLIITYKELRNLENKVIMELLKLNNVTTNNNQLKLFSLTSDSLNQTIDDNTGFNSRGEFTKNWHNDKYAVPLIQVNVGQFYGIEVQSYACDITKVGLWLEDHLMNTIANEKFFNAVNFTRIPIKNSGHILNDNALRVDWNDFIGEDPVDYILGNPPFIGAKKMKEKIVVSDIEIEPKKDILELVPSLKNNGNLDYVCGWYIKASQYMNRHTSTKSCLVSTKSISKGVQAPTLWNYLVSEYYMDIDFAYSNFKWDNSGAAVNVVIIGFSKVEKSIGIKKKLFHLTNNGNIKMKYVDNINEYLLDQRWVFINPTNRIQISNSLPMKLGLLALDNDYYVIKREKYLELIKKNPTIKKYIHPYYGADQLLNDGNIPSNYFIYTPDIDNEKDEKFFSKEINLVREFRSTVSKEDRKLQYTPTKLKRDRYYKSNILALPRHLKQRDYPVIRFFTSDDIVSDGTYQIPYENNDDAYYTFGILSSSMHNVWSNVIMGSLGISSRYSNNMVYNNLVFPNVTENQKETIIDISKKIREVRSNIIDKYSLAYLYDGHLTPELLKLHFKLDAIVDDAYANRKLKSNKERWDVLIKLYYKNTDKKEN